MRTLKTAALILEPQTAEHAEAMFVVLRDPAIYEFENAPPVSADWLHARFLRLEARASPDGAEQWLNWVIRLTASQQLAGYVQATITDQHALIAYELSSAHWGKGIARAAVSAVLQELAQHYGIKQYFAILKRHNIRSKKLLDRLGFVQASATELLMLNPDADENAMFRKTYESGPDWPDPHHPSGHSSKGAGRPK
ncbi:GNAT family N-acetyltransferase [Iodobacter arcticus]|uniref:GNAT family N-acetyltransferase n=1 Tax=Iodobacter arcticus TaxID=590593 RepID=A0ABW2R1I9_9NEIS